MIIAAIKPGDLVRCDRRGRLFEARVTAREPYALAIEPLRPNTNYYSAKSNEVRAHWAARPARNRKVSTGPIREGDIVAFTARDATTLAHVIARKGQVLRVLELAACAQPRELPVREVTDHYARRGRTRRAQQRT
jgi:hypothetical protein